MKLIDYFDRTCIIHLPERVDRFLALERELKPLGIDIRGPKVQIPYAPRPEDANGFPSRGVYGSFLSHYGILRDALQDKLNTVWVLEDDAIFSRRMALEQDRIVDFLQGTEWDICYFGHSLNRELDGMERGFVRYHGEFRWAHCYAVHGRVLPRLVGYLEETMTNPRGHPRGGRVYIDGAYALFRRFNPDIASLVANPAISLQKGCVSSLGESHWYDRQPFTLPLVTVARRVRDELWRRTGLYFPVKTFN
jgi:hypothetical protein